MADQRFGVLDNYLRDRRRCSIIAEEAAQVLKRSVAQVQADFLTFTLPNGGNPAVASWYPGGPRNAWTLELMSLVTPGYPAVPSPNPQVLILHYRRERLAGRLQDEIFNGDVYYNGFYMMQPRRFRSILESLNIARYSLCTVAALDWLITQGHLYRLDDTVPGEIVLAQQMNRVIRNGLGNNARAYLRSRSQLMEEEIEVERLAVELASLRSSGAAQAQITAVTTQLGAAMAARVTAETARRAARDALGL